MRDHARDVFDTALAAADAAEAVGGALRLEGQALKVGPQGGETCSLDLATFRRVVLVGAGKASAPMARAVESVLGDRVSGGLVVVKYGHGEPLRRAELKEAAHPVPDEAGQEAARALLALLDGCGPQDLVVCCLSGGGSALLPAPAGRISLEDKQALTRLLLESGAGIDEINALRKHCSRAKGGQLARMAAPATVVDLIISDVVGGRIDSIASGPFAPDATTFEECHYILERYGLSERIPRAVAIHLKNGLEGEEPETPKPGDSCFDKVYNIVVADNLKALDAAAERARELGYRPCVLTSTLQGEAREAGKMLAAAARAVQDSGKPVSPPACLLAGGETTVTVRGRGAGGRCQELALSAALALEGRRGVALLAAGTDGADGPTDAAGALADGRTVERGFKRGLDPRRHLEDNDSYPFFKALGDLVVTGPTRTNVMDLVCILIRPSPE